MRYLSCSVIISKTQESKNALERLLCLEIFPIKHLACWSYSDSSYQPLRSQMPAPSPRSRSVGHCGARKNTPGRFTGARSIEISIGSLKQLKNILSFCCGISGGCNEFAVETHLLLFELRSLNLFRVFPFFLATSSLNWFLFHLDHDNSPT